MPNLTKLKGKYHLSAVMSRKGHSAKVVGEQYGADYVTTSYQEILSDDMLFTKCGWIYQYNAIPNNEENKLTNYFMEKTYKYFYGDLK